MNKCIIKDSYLKSNVQQPSKRYILLWLYLDMESFYSFLSINWNTVAIQSERKIVDAITNLSLGNEVVLQQEFDCGLNCAAELRLYFFMNLPDVIFCTS